MIYPAWFYGKGVLPDWVALRADFSSTAFVESADTGSSTMYFISKQPRETFIGVGIDFSARLAAQEYLISVNILQELISGVEGTGNPLFVTNKALSVSTGVASATIGGGYDGCTYKLTFTVSGSMGSVLESEIKVKVKET